MALIKDYDKKYTQKVKPTSDHTHDGRHRQRGIPAPRRASAANFLSTS
jgi:hypothetical protein